MIRTYRTIAVEGVAVALRAAESHSGYLGTTPPPIGALRADAGAGNGIVGRSTPWTP